MKMYELNKADYKKIRSYRKFKQEEIALYFFEKFGDDLLDITYNKINRKFSSIPFEKGDLIHIMWNSLKTTLKRYKDDDNFYACLLNNCYINSIKEIKKFLKNSELVLNYSTSLESSWGKYQLLNNKNIITNIQKPSSVVLEEIILVACKYLKNYTQPTIKRVIYLKSLGWSFEEIGKKLRKKPWVIRSMVEKIWLIIKKYYL